MNNANSHFICEEIVIHFDIPPTRLKAPPCPNGFTWREKEFHVIETIAEWHDFTRRGRLAHNMSPAHKGTASQHGSLGVGRFYFRVRTDSLQVFDLYYDREVRNVDDRLGHWFLLSEIF
jgi:hypothetical protein